MIVAAYCPLARELGPDGIRVNAIAPGFVPTEGLQAAVAAIFIPLAVRSYSRRV